MEPVDQPETEKCACGGDIWNIADILLSDYTLANLVQCDECKVVFCRPE